MKFIKSMDYKYKVCSECFTYNHETYIKKALDGFSMQETTFPVVTVIIDDASTDTTAVVIRQYMIENFDFHYSDSCQKETDYGTVVFARHKENLNCFFAVIYLKENHYQKGKFHLIDNYIKSFVDASEYIAFCEGDDYWTSPNKLQKQVEQLDAHPNFMMVYTDYVTVDQQGNSIYRKEYEGILKPSSKTGDILPSLFIKNFPMTPTTMYCKKVFLSPVLKNAPLSIDYLYCMTAAFMGDCCYIPEKKACYRKSPDGMMNSQLEMVVAKINVLNKYFALEYVKGHSKKETFRNHYSIMQTICLRFMDDKEVMGQLIEANGKVRFWKTIFGMKRSLHQLLK